jgi:hypothetical protein
MRVATRCDAFIAAHGNQPGDNQGDVVVVLAAPVEGSITAYTVPSGAVTLAAESGNVSIVQVLLPDGRRLSLFPANVIGIIDAP